MINFQLQELNSTFNDNMVELMILSLAFYSEKMCATLRVDDICKLVHKFYSNDFAEYDMTMLHMILQHFDQVQKFQILL